MKLRTLLVIFSIVTLCIGSVGCSRIIFQSDFESYSAGEYGILYPLSPPGEPSDDRFIKGNDCSVKVINSARHGSKAVKLYENNCTYKYLQCVVGGGPYTEGEYIIKYKAYAMGTIEKTLHVSVHSYSGDYNVPAAERALILGFYAGSFKLTSGSGEETLSGVTYAPNVVHSVSIRIDMTLRKFWVTIDGISVASDKSFEHYGFDDLRVLYFSLGQGATSDDAYVIDDIKITKTE